MAVEMQVVDKFNEIFGTEGNKRNIFHSGKS